MVGLKTEWEIEPAPRECTLAEYKGAEARWCPGCGDHSVLSAVQKMARDKQIPPERIVVVSGIGCSSRFPHYISSYGFHSLHGRPLPVACGVKSRRPDLHVFAVTGDGDCCAIGAGHWIHAIRYNMNITILMLDNSIYGLTKGQTSPTTRLGRASSTHPHGSPLPPLNPLTITLGVSNVSFVAQTVDWNPPHLYATIRAAHDHEGAAFVRVLQRCPHFTGDVYADALEDRSHILLLEHEDGIHLEPAMRDRLKNRIEHDPGNLGEAFQLAARTDVYPVGLFYRNPDAVRYDLVTAHGMGKTPSEKLRAIEEAIERFAI
jgi:2-oxoglutarate ferredoxin oxidoreductase subunit beta